MTTLVVGCGARLLSGLQGQLPDGSVVVAEHPELIEKRSLRARAARFSVVAELVPYEFVYGCDPRALTVPDVECVIPATDEEAAVAAADIADHLGLPGAGPRAARIFRDKLELRAAAQAAGLPNPEWHEVRGPADLAEVTHEEYVLKPARRSGSTGVQLLRWNDDPEEAWRQTVTAEGKVAMERPPPTRYLVEERLHGPEVSAECLVVAGEVVFANVTQKHVLPGRYPVEIGHALPHSGDLLPLMRTLVKATEFGHGILHAEWILTAGGPVLVECAARIPGDRITDLISLAYGVPFVARYAALLRGENPDMPAAAERASAIMFLTPPPGTVERVTGAEEAAALAHEVSVDVEPGDRVDVPRASRDRSGHVIALGADPAQAWRLATRAAELIRITTT